jgi:DNA-binding HxlR family transcriptional regulator
MAQRCGNGAHDEHDVYAALCPCRDVLEVLAGKWSALAIGALEAGPERFGALQKRLEGVSPKVLTRTLRRLEEYGFVTRTVFPAVPARVEYELTDLGRGAARPLARLRDWVEAHVDLTRPGSGPGPDRLATVEQRQGGARLGS